VRKTILLYGTALAVLIIFLKAVEYRYVVRDLSLEFYLGLVAVVFTGLGIWAGLRLTRKKVVVVTDPEFQLDEAERLRRGITPREIQVLELMARGMSNQEIADSLFVSLNTVKSHSSSLFGKLDARRRTQAIQKAKELRLLP